MILEFSENFSCPKDTVGPESAYYVIPHTLNYYETGGFSGIFKTLEELPEEVKGVKVHSIRELSEESGPVKVIFPYKPEFYHFFEVLASIVAELETTKRSPKEWVAYLLIPKIWTSEWYRDFVDLFITRVFDHYGVKIKAFYLPVTRGENGGTVSPVIIRNAEVVYATWENFNISSYMALRKFIRSWPEIQEKKKGKVAYIQRKSKSENNIPDLRELELFKNSPDYIKYPETFPRISKEHEVVNSLKRILQGKGRDMEVVSSEDFVSISEQIKYYSTVDVVIAPTGSGFMNMIFMEDTATVVELVSPLVTRYNFRGEEYLKQEYDNIYSIQAFISNLNYMGIPHFRDPEDLINKLDNLNFPL